MADHLPECERFRDVPHRYANCRGERLTEDKCNKWRASHGLPPLGNATTPPAGSPPKSAKRGCGKKPSLARKVWNYATALARWNKAGRPERTQDQIDQCLAICQACDQFDADKAHCKLCGCALNRSPEGWRNKLAMATESCPHPDGPKWTATVEATP